MLLRDIPYFNIYDPFHYNPATQLTDVSSQEDYLGILTGQPTLSTHSSKSGWATVEDVIQVPQLDSESTDTRPAEESCLPKSEIEVLGDFTPALLIPHRSIAPERLRHFASFLQVSCCMKVAFERFLLVHLCVRR